MISGTQAQAYLSITGNFPPGFHNGDIFCINFNCYYNGAWNSGYVGDIDLSQPIVFTISGMGGTTLSGLGTTPVVQAESWIHYSFQLFEADGVTPVYVTATPEPATYGLWASPWRPTGPTGSDPNNSSGNFKKQPSGPISHIHPKTSVSVDTPR